MLTVRESNHPTKFEAAPFETCGYRLEKTFTGTLFYQGGDLIVAEYFLYRRRP